MRRLWKVSPRVAPPLRALAVVSIFASGAFAAKCAPALAADHEGDAQPGSSAPVSVSSVGTPGDTSLVSVARRVTPAVVYIEAEVTPRVASRQGQLPPGFELPPGMQLMPPGGQQRRGPQLSSGSGFIVSANGEILTNNHVVEDAQRLTVTLYDRRIFTAKVIGRDPATDVALIKIDATGLPTLPLGDDSTVQVGQTVMAVGAPLGLRSTVTSGIISAKDRGGDLAGLFGGQTLAVVDFLQTDAVINPGNSGGPLLDLAGRVIGINSAIESPTGVYAGYGFAVPVGIARIAMEQFREYGRVRRAILGVSIVDVTATDARAAGMNEIRGALVNAFSGTNTAAERAGLKPGDVILSIDGRPISSVSMLQRLIYGYRPGSTVTLTYQRFGTQGTAKVTLQEAPNEPQVASGGARSTTPDAAPAGALGIQVAPLTPQVASRLGIDASVRGLAIADVDPQSPARGLLAGGDVITASIGRGGAQRPVMTAADLRDATAAAPNGVVTLLIYNSRFGPNGGTRVVNVPVSR
jgi:serine protease Do